MKSKLEIRIIEVENGYVVCEDGPELRHLVGPKWVSESIPGLTQLVETLAYQAKLEANALKTGGEENKCI